MNKRVLKDKCRSFEFNCVNIDYQTAYYSRPFILRTDLTRLHSDSEICTDLARREGRGALT